MTMSKTVAGVVIAAALVPAVRAAFQIAREVDQSYRVASYENLGLRGACQRDAYGGYVLSRFDGVRGSGRPALTREFYLTSAPAGDGPVPQIERFGTSAITVEQNNGIASSEYFARLQYGRQAMVLSSPTGRVERCIVQSEDGHQLWSYAGVETFEGAFTSGRLHPVAAEQPASMAELPKVTDPAARDRSASGLNVTLP